MAIENEIKAEAARKAYPINSLAAAMGSYPGKLSRSFNGKREMRSSEIFRAARALGVPAWVLVRRAELNEANTNEKDKQHE